MAELDAEVRQLLSEHVTGYEQLEALLLLHRDSRQSSTGEQLGAELRIDAGSMATALAELAEHGLLERRTGPPPSYRYAPVQTALAAAVDRLAQLYTEQRLEIIRQMSANAIERLRSSAARSFSEAFLLRGRGK
ncbi:MAG TPA: hypothetical protein VID71_10045 [Steroidobacteraceae bacterium]